MSRADGISLTWVLLLILTLTGLGATVYNFNLSIEEPSSACRDGETVETLRETVSRDEREAQQMRTDEKLIIFRLNRIESRLLRLELETRATKN